MIFRLPKACYAAKSAVWVPAPQQKITDRRSTKSNAKQENCGSGGRDEGYRQTCGEMGVRIKKGVLSCDPVHMFVTIPPHLALSTVMQRIKGRSSRRIQMEFPDLQKCHWGRRFWARGYFSTASGNITDEVILQYFELQSKRKPADVSRQWLSQRMFLIDVSTACKKDPEELLADNSRNESLPSFRIIVPRCSIIVRANAPCGNAWRKS